MEASKISELPPGFRFHPTDEELIMYYLKNQVASKTCPIPIISEVNIYKFDPWELPEKAEFGEKEWYFFSPRNRKYPNGERPNRATTSGYWKATGTDKGIHSGSKYVGVKKTLVFYQGRPPKGVKTSWIMNEYRLADSRKYPTKINASPKLDDWVLCRIHRKGHSGRSEESKTIPGIENTEMSLPATFSLETDHEHLLNSHVLNENNLDPTNVMQSNENGYGNSYNIDMDKFYLTDADYRFPDSVKVESNQNAIFSPHILADGVLDFLQY